MAVALVVRWFWFEWAPGDVRAICVMLLGEEVVLAGGVKDLRVERCGWRGE